MFCIQGTPLMMSERGIESVRAGMFDVIEAIQKKMRISVENGVATIPICGILTKRPEDFFSTSYEGIRNDIAEALADPLIKEIWLDIDSPGGEVSGLFDLVDFIYASRDVKPIYAFANDMACSAAYAIASAASKIFVNRTSEVGSVGVIATHVDVSEAEKQAGIRYTNVYAGAKKNDLSPHNALSEQAVGDLQSEVDRLYGIFIKTVARNRGMSEEKLRETEAAIFHGEEAIASGLADEIETEFATKGDKGGGIVASSGISEERKEGMENDIQKYKTEVIEIAKLCKLAHSEH